MKFNCIQLYCVRCGKDTVHQKDWDNTKCLTCSHTFPTSELDHSGESTMITTIKTQLFRTTLADLIEQLEMEGTTRVSLAEIKSLLEQI